MYKAKFFFSLATISTIALPLTVVSCSNSKDSLLKFENIINFNKKEYTKKVSSGDYLDSSDKKYYNDLFAYTIFRKQNIYKKYFLTDKNPKVEKQKIDNLNKKINSIIKSNETIKKMLKIYFAKSLYFAYKKIWDKNELGGFFEVKNKIVEQQYTKYSELITPDDTSVSSEKYKFENLNKLIDSIGEIKLELLSNSNVSGDSLSYNWKYSFELRKGSKLASLFQDKEAKEIEDSIFSPKRALTDYQLEKINKQTSEEAKLLVRKFFEYRNTGMYWDNATNTINSIPFQSNISITNILKTPNNRYFAKKIDDNNYQQEFLVNSLVSIDFLQESNDTFKPIIRFNTAQMFQSSDNIHYWDNYMEWITKKTNTEIYKEKNVYFDVDFDSFKYTGFKKDTKDA